MARTTKIFQILHGFCYWDASQVLNTVEEASQRFAPTLLFVEAPIYVREGWAYDHTKEGDERFICPTPPEGWTYDLETGRFVQLEETVEENNEVEEEENGISESEDE